MNVKCAHGIGFGEKCPECETAQERRAFNHASVRIAIAAKDAEAALESRIALWDAVLAALGHLHRPDSRETTAALA